MSSCFVISLDFELHWGVFDHTPLDARSKAYFLRARALVVPTLALFERYQISATWATVGMLFARNKEELLAALPSERPAYRNPKLNPYLLLEAVGKDEEEDPFHYAPSLIAAIASTPGQRIGSHTFSHYYCLEPGQNSATFAADLMAAKELAEQNFGLSLRSLVFPRNQYEAPYLEVLKALGFHSYRTNPAVWFWAATGAENTSKAQKIARFLDHYVPIDQDTTFPKAAGKAYPIDIPASRLFRPFIKRIDGYGGQFLKLERICLEMTRAAEMGRVYHLWWHPHNLATAPAKNMAALEYLLKHYQTLADRFGMQTCSMEDLYQS